MADLEKRKKDDFRVSVLDYWENGSNSKESGDSQETQLKGESLIGF